MDLVGRKLPLRGGGVVKDFLVQVAALDGELAAAGDEFASIRAALADGVAALDDATAWLLEHGAADPVAALAGATPYLRMFGTVTGGWLLARSALAAQSLMPDDPCGALAGSKVAVARFYAEQLLPAARGLLGAVTAGARDLFAIPADQL
jgi:hypothetical protein